MRIVSVLAGLMLAIATTNVLARGSRCQRVACECAPVVCCSASVCAKPSTVCCTPLPTAAVLEERAAPIAASEPNETKSSSPRRPKPLAIERADPELDAYLAEWEKASSKIRRLDCEFLKFIYDPIFEVEKRGRGTLALERDRRARYRIAPAALVPGDASQKISKDGSQYELKACSAECWHWTGPELFKFDDEEHIYETMRLPPGDAAYLFSFFQFTNERLDLLFVKPFVLGMAADRLKTRFKVKLRKVTGDELWLELIPRFAADTCFQKAVLILNRRTWLTHALKLYDPTGSETVYVFQNIRVNPAEGDDLSKANLEGYRQVLSNVTRKTESSQ